jgi:WD40 repeat protein
VANIPRGGLGRRVRCPKCRKSFIAAPDSPTPPDRTAPLSPAEFEHLEKPDNLAEATGVLEQTTDYIPLAPITPNDRTKPEPAAPAHPRVTENQEMAGDSAPTAPTPPRAADQVEKVGDSRPADPKSVRERASATEEIYAVKRSAEEPLGVLDQIGRFQIRALLGEGAFGRVYRAYDPQLDREVALKVPRLAEDKPGQQERFLREAKAAARLRHPGIVTVYDSGTAGADIFIASECVEGQTLDAILSNRLPKIRRAAQWVRDLAKALDYAHRQGVIHRDIKPGNIIIDPQGKPRLMDFGLAKRLGSTVIAGAAGPAGGDLRLTQEGRIMGTPAYMAPEQARGDPSAVGRHSDQFSLGVVLYELLTGTRPYSGKTVYEVLCQLVDPKVEPPRPRTLKPKISVELEAICLKALAYEPGRRYGNCGELADDLSCWLAGKPVEALPQGPMARLLGWYRRKPAQAIALGVGAVTLLLIALVAVGLTAYGRHLSRVARENEERLAELKRQEKAQREQALQAECQSLRQNGLARCSTKRTKEGVLLLARAFAKATELGDETLERAVGADLLEWLHQVDEPAPLKPMRREAWAAVSRLLGVALQSDAGPGARAGAEPGAGKAVRLLGIPVMPDQPVQLAGFNAISSTVLAATATSWRWWETTTGKPAGPVHEYRARALTPDGAKVLAVIAEGNGATLCLRDAVTGDALGPKFHCRSVSDPVFLSPDGGLAVVVHGPAVGGQGLADLVDTVQGKSLDTPMSKDWHITGLAFSQDGQRLLGTWGRGPQRLARLWYAPKHMWLGPPFPLAQDGPDIVAMSLGPDGRTLLTVGGDNELWLWQMAADLGNLLAGRGIRFEPLGRPLEPNGSGPVRVAALSPNGQSVVAGAGDTVTFWESPTTKRTGEALAQKMAQGAAFDSNGKRLLTWGGQLAQIWDAETLRPIGLPLNHPAGISAAALSPNGQSALLLGGGKLRVWPVELSRQDRSDGVRLWAELLTQMEVDDQGECHSLAQAAWSGRHRQFEDVIGVIGGEAKPP